MGAPGGVLSKSQRGVGRVPGALNLSVTDNIQSNTNLRSDPKTSDSERENNPLQKAKTSNTMENLNKNPDANANKYNTKQINNSNGNIINNDSNRLTSNDSFFGKVSNFIITLINPVYFFFSGIFKIFKGWFGY